MGGKSRFDEAVADYALAYADQVEKDFALFRAASRAGRFPTETTPTEVATAIR
jgi:hypothetical protein